MITYLEQKNLFVLREKVSGKALNVSYSPAGLKYTMNPFGKYVYFKNAWTEINTNKNKLVFRGNLKVNSNLVIEKFVPRQFEDPKLAKIELVWVQKAYRLLYNTSSIL